MLRIVASRGLAVWLAAIMVVSANAASADIAFVDPSSSDSRFGWDFDLNNPVPGSIHARWDVFTNPFGPPGNLPDGTTIGSGATSTITQTVEGAFIAGSGNIYSFGSVNDFDLVIDSSDLSGPVTTVAVQFKTLGTELDYDSILLDGLTPTFTEELFRQELGGFGGFDVEYLAIWRLGQALTSYQVDFTAAGSSLSLDEVRVDAYASVPEPSTVTLLGGMALTGLMLRRRRHSSSR